MADYKTDDPTLKKALREALTGVNGGNDFDDLGEEEAPPKRSGAFPCRKCARVSVMRASSALTHTGT